MNILYVHRTQGSGVERIHIIGVVNAFRSMGHKVKIVSPPGVDIETPEKNISVGNIPKTKSGIKWIVKNLPESLFEIIEILLNIVTYLRIIGELKRDRYELIYERYALNTFAATFAARKYGIPIVTEINDASFIERVRKLTMKNVAASFEKWVFTNSTRLIVISSYFKDLIIQRGISGDKIVVLPNAVDADAVINKDLSDKVNATPGTVVIGYVGAFVYWHRVDMLLKAFNDLVKDDVDIRLVLVGDGVTYNDSKEFVRVNNIEGKVHMVGRVDHNEVMESIGSMDICVIPDSNYYGSPMKLFEYMSRGKAVVGPDVDPLKDVIKNGYNGVLFKKGNVDELKNSIRELVHNSDTRMKLGENARKSVIGNHTWQENGRKTLEGIF